MLTTLLAVASAIHTPALPPSFPRGIQLPERARGEEALHALGNRLPEVAAFYRKSPAEFRTLLRQERTLWADREGRLFHVCEWQPAPEEAVTGDDIGTTDPSPFPAEQTFRLHSRPGAGKKIYLDFDGHDASGTSWGADAIARPFDTDGNPNAFSSAERDRIVYIWQRVAEDFAMYDLDVTTEDPGSAALINSGGGDTNYGIRVIIGGSSGDWYGSAGGVAYLNSFDDNSDLPCWVFPKSLGPDNEKYIAEAISHEVGHTLGLSHDGTTTGTEYYSGHGNWAPIMGVGYYEPVSQWSRGEYANANRSSQDDLAVMLNYGATYRADDHGDNLANATALNGVFFETNGVISTRTDLDFFSFTTGAGRVSLNVSRPPRDSNLRLEVKLYNHLGVLLQTTNVADTTAGTQPVTLTADLAAGTYAFSVDGIGSGDPLSNGYSDYGSLGQYLISGTLPNDAGWLPTAGGPGYLWLTPANWSSNTVPNGGGATVRINNNITGNQTISLIEPLTLGRLFLGDANATHTFTLQNGGGGSLTFAALNDSALLTKTAGDADTISLPLVLQNDLLLTNTTANPLILSGPITGAGRLVKTGSGPLNLESTASHAGGTVIAAGTLQLGVAASLAGSIEVQSSATLDVAAPGGLALTANQTLRGSGTVSGNVSAGASARIQPGLDGGAGTLTFNHQLALNDGARLGFDLSHVETGGGGTNDLLAVAGDLVLNGMIVVDFNFLTNGPVSPGTYTLIQYSGALSGSAANFTAATLTNRYTFTFDDSVPGEIRVAVTGEPGALVWTGATNNLWDVSNTNWLAGALPAQFQQLDAVVFDESGFTTPTVNLNEVLQPASVTVNNTVNYILTGSGGLAGATGLLKSGPGSLTLGTANSFTGPVLVNEGTLVTANPAALGSANGATTVANGAALNLNGIGVGAEPLFVNGAGPSGSGVIVNTGATQSNAVRFLTLTGPTTLGGTTRWDIRAQPTAALAGNNFSLTKAGPNEIRLVDLDNTGLGDITVAQGTLAIQDSTTLGAANSNLTVQTGGTLALWNTDVNALNKRLALNGGSMRNEAGNNLFTGPVTLNSNATVHVVDGLQIQGVIGGAAGFTKTGAGTLSLAAANTFTGIVTVTTGTLRAGNATAFGRTNSGVIIASDARLDVAGFNLGAEPVTVSGDGLGNAGAIVNYGGSQQNALRFVTLSGNTTFGGISRWDIRANPTASLGGNNRTLTKRGPNEIWLVNLGDTGLGAITVAEGLLGIQGTTTLGSATSNLTVNSRCTLGLYATGTNVLRKAATFSGGKLANQNGTNFFDGNIAFSGSNTVEVATNTLLELGGLLTGSGTIFKTGDGTLIVSSNNTRTGPTSINAGTLQIGNGGGAGSPGQGPITNNGALVYHRTNDLTLSAFILGTGTLTKLGPGVLTLSAANSFTGAVTVNALNAGIIRLRNSTALGSGVKTINLKSGGSPNSAGSFGVEVENNITLGTNYSWLISNDGLANAPFIPALRSRSGINTLAGNLLIQSGGGGARIVSDAGSTFQLTGRITTDVTGGRDLFLDGAGNGTVSGVITNGATASQFINVIKEGAGQWTFSGTNTSSGAIQIRAGAFVLDGWTGANPLTVSNGATLRGTGTVNGAVVVHGAVQPGTATDPGTLTVNNSLTLAGTAQFRVTKSPAPAHDQVRGLTTVTYGGTLAVIHTGGELAAGDTFQLFGAGNYTGNFDTIILPPNPPGLTWSNRLALDGSLVLVPVVPPTISSIALEGTNLTLQFLSEAGTSYVLESATNLEPPVLWSPFSTNVGDGGIRWFTVPFQTEDGQRFFRLNAY